VASRRDEIRYAPWWLWAAHYLLYAGVLYVTFMGFWLWRSTIQNLTDVLMYRDPWRQPVYLAATMIIGLTLFAIAMGGEGYVRGALSRPVATGSYVFPLARRYGRVLLALIGVIGAGALAQELLFRAVR
jgi:hypothetical protein